MKKLRLSKRMKIKYVLPVVILGFVMLVIIAFGIIGFLCFVSIGSSKVQDFGWYTLVSSTFAYLGVGTTFGMSVEDLFKMVKRKNKKERELS